jgi:hypothetical protein
VDAPLGLRRLCAPLHPHATAVQQRLGLGEVACAQVLESLLDRLWGGGMAGFRVRGLREITKCMEIGARRSWKACLTAWGRRAGKEGVGARQEEKEEEEEEERTLASAQVEVLEAILDETGSTHARAHAALRPGNAPAP